MSKYMKMIAILVLTVTLLWGCGDGNLSEQKEDYTKSVSTRKVENESETLFSTEETDDYNVKIVEYIQDNAYIEYPQVYGLKDTKKQATINEVLKEGAWYGAKGFEYRTLVDLSDPNDEYTCRIKVGLVNREIISCICDLDIYCGYDRPGFHTYGVTVDMRTGKKIELSDFMEIDERLINSSDGDSTEPDYGSPCIPKFHKFKDAFEIYDSKEEEDSYHIRSVQNAIYWLEDRKGESNW